MADLVQTAVASPRVSELCNSPRSLPPNKAESVMIITPADRLRNRVRRVVSRRRSGGGFAGEALERRPWADKREDRPKGAPNSLTGQCSRRYGCRWKRGKDLENGAGNYREPLQNCGLGDQLLAARNGRGGRYTLCFSSESRTQVMNQLSYFTNSVRLRRMSWSRSN